MTAVVGSDAAVDSGTSRTLEEQLRRTHGHLCLAADLVDLQAGAPDAGWPAGRARISGNHDRGAA